MIIDAPHQTKSPVVNTQAPPVRDISEEELDALMQRVKEARDHNLALSSDDYDVLMNAVLMLANMQERLQNNDLTVAKLKKLLGMVNSSQETKRPSPQHQRR